MAVAAAAEAIDLLLPRHRDVIYTLVNKAGDPERRGVWMGAWIPEPFFSSHQAAQTQWPGKDHCWAAKTHCLFGRLICGGNLAASEEIN